MLIFEGRAAYHCREFNNQRTDRSRLHSHTSLGLRPLRRGINRLYR
jgi:hypothetical protein